MHARPGPSRVRYGRRCRTPSPASGRTTSPPGWPTARAGRARRREQANARWRREYGRRGSRPPPRAHRRPCRREDPKRQSVRSSWEETRSSWGMNAIIQPNAEPINIQREFFPAMYIRIECKNHAVNAATVHHRGQESATLPCRVVASPYGRVLHQEATTPRGARADRGSRAIKKDHAEWPQTEKWRQSGVVTTGLYVVILVSLTSVLCARARQSRLEFPNRRPTRAKVSPCPFTRTHNGERCINSASGVRTTRRRASPIRLLLAQSLGKRRPLCNRHVARSALEQQRPPRT